MKLKQAVVLFTGLLPACLFAQTNTGAGNAPITRQINLRPGGGPGMTTAPGSSEMPDKGKLSYAIGMYFGNSLKNTMSRGNLDYDLDTVFDAMRSVVKGTPPKMNELEVRATLQKLSDAMRKAGGPSNDKAVKDFMAQFAKAPGVKTLPDGIEYKVITEGKGGSPKPDDMVTVNYRGTLANGTEFDKNDGSTLRLRQTIRGWQEVLPMMKTGSKWQVAIPPQLAYGQRGSPPRIPGNSALVFDIELKDFKPAPAQPPMAANARPAPVTPMVSQEIIKVPSADELKKGAQIEVIKAGQTNVITNTALPAGSVVQPPPTK